MAKDVYYQFPQTLGQARRCGARGGKATARNRRQRLDSAETEMHQPLANEAEPQVPVETTVGAIALLDAQFPWLRGVERRCSKRHSQLEDGVLAICPSPTAAVGGARTGPRFHSCTLPEPLDGDVSCG